MSCIRLSPTCTRQRQGASDALTSLGYRENFGNLSFFKFKSLACGQVAGDKGVLELSDFVIPMREGEAAYRLRDAAFLAELDIAVTQTTTEHVVRLWL